MVFPVKELGKVFLNSIFPFFKDSKALELIKNDALEVKEDLLAKLYDKVKGVFVKGSKESILEQLHKNPEDKVWQAAADASISEELKNNEDFHKQLAEYVKNLEEEYAPQVAKMINEHKIKGSGNMLSQGADNEMSNGAEMTNKSDIEGNNNQVYQGQGNRLN